MSRGKRRYLLALVSGTICPVCKSAPRAEWARFFLRECGPCAVKRVDREMTMGGYV